MATALFEEQSAKVREAYGVGLGASASVFADERLTIVERPESNWGYVVNGVAFAKGSLLAVAPELVEFAREKAPLLHRIAVTDHHFRVLRREAVRLGLGDALQVFAGAIGWALAREPEAPVLPVGLRFEAVTKAWLNEEIPRARFENGAGPPDGSGGRPFRNQYGVSIIDSAGEVAALAGVFDTFGMHEIGVDVLPGHQGQGLGAAVVRAATRAILECGGLPFYGCGATNIRSQHTALASGFMPVCADGAIS